MKTNVLSPKEFMVQEGNNDLRSYIDYLEKIQVETEQDLKNAEEFSMSDSVLEEIQKQSRQILKMLDMVQNNLQDILFHSIDELSLEELQGYFDFEKSQRERAQKIFSEEKQIEIFEEQLHDVRDRIDANLYSNGRNKKFYTVSDTSLFFQDVVSTKVYIESLLSSDSVGDYSNLESDIKYTLQLEMKRQNLPVSLEQTEEITFKIMEFLKKCRKVCAYSTEALLQLVEVVLSEDGIGSVLQSYFEKNPYRTIFTDFIYLGKRYTNFYKQLPLELQNQLLTERFQGKTYQKLAEVYQAFEQGREPDNSDINQQEFQEMNEIVKNLQRSKNECSRLFQEDCAESEFFLDAQAMRTAIKSEIKNLITNKQVMKEMNQVVSEVFEEKQMTKGFLERLKASFELKEKQLKLAQEVLKNPDYSSFFQAVEKKNMYLFYKVLGSYHTEEELFSHLEVEKGRFEQIRILVSIQDELDEIAHQKKQYIQKFHFFPKRNKSYQEKLENFDLKYEDAISKSAISNVFLSESGYRISPNLDDLKFLSHEFWDMSKGIGEKTRCQFLKRENVKEDWDSYRKEITILQKKLVEQLFCYDLVDGYYQFQLSVLERRILLNTQKTIVEIIESAYQERKAFRESLEKADIALPLEKVQVLESLLGKGNNMSKESLAIFIVKTQTEIKSLEKEMLRHMTVSEDLGIELPVQNKFDQDIVEVEFDFDEKIRNLEIDGVNTLEDAVQYQMVSNELARYRVAASSIRNSYVKKKILI